MKRKLACLLLCASGWIHAAEQQLGQSVRDAIRIGHTFHVRPNQTYVVASGQALKLDVYFNPRSNDPQPVLLNIHGGGWIQGSKEETELATLPYLAMNFAVINIDYRLDDVAPAPAAVEDSLCAVRWIARNASLYNFDLSRIVINGGSAGGHLALLAAMMPADAPLGRRCASMDGNWTGQLGNPPPKVAAVINWFGITDMADVLNGPNARSFARRWFAGNDQDTQLAQRISPLTYVHAGGVPVLTIHGDTDPVVPYAHAQRLHQALSAAHVKNELVTIKGAGHGGFTQEQNVDIYSAIHAFLLELGVLGEKAPALR